MAVDVAYAQRGMGDWMTSAFDAQRSSWVRTDAKISPDNMRKPGFELVWKVKVDNPARQLNSLTPPALIDFYIGYRGFRALGFFGIASDRVIAIDTELSRTEWEKGFAAKPGPAGTLECPGGMTSAVTRPTGIAYPPVPAGFGTGRGTPAKSGVGLPHEGAVTIRSTPPPPPPVPARAAGPAAAAPNPFAPRVQWVMALSGDGKLHSMYLSNGHEPKEAAQFVPANANARGLIVYDNTAYVATTNSCGGVENGVWALDLAASKVSHWKSPGNVAGTAGPAVGPDGTLYVAGGGGELTALTAKTLEPRGSYKSGGVEFSSSPVIFEFRGKNLIAVATNDGRLHLVDSADLNSGRALAKTEIFTDPGFDVGSLTSWQDPTGTRWLLAAGSGAKAAAAGFQEANGKIQNGAIFAWKVIDKGGVPALQPAWVSRDLLSPIPPLVINGVVFALSSGEFRSNDGKMTAAQRAQRSGKAVLYALDSTTGKDLWNSASIITSFVHSGGLAAGGSRVYVGAHDGTQYAFGYPIEH